MAEMIDCLVNYFSQDTDAEGMPRRYLSYLVIGGPGPIPEGGVATITPLAAYNANEVCETCERAFAVKVGGPAAALDEALIYLDAYHEGDGLEKVQTEIRCYSCQDQSLGRQQPRQRTDTTPAVPRIDAADLKARLESGQAVTVLDARSPAAWDASRVKIRGAFPVKRDQLEVNPSWPRDRLTVVYCT
jgi:hypothetical protein